MPLLATSGILQPRPLDNETIPMELVDESRPVVYMEMKWIRVLASFVRPVIRHACIQAPFRREHPMQLRQQSIRLRKMFQRLHRYREVRGTISHSRQILRIADNEAHLYRGIRGKTGTGVVHRIVTGIKSNERGRLAIVGKLVGAVPQAACDVDDAIPRSNELRSLCIAGHVRIGSSPSLASHVRMQIALFHKRAQRIGSNGCVGHAFERHQQQPIDTIQLTVWRYALVLRMFAPLLADGRCLPLGTRYVGCRPPTRRHTGIRISASNDCRHSSAEPTSA